MAVSKLTVLAKKVMSSHGLGTLLREETPIGPRDHIIGKGFRASTEGSFTLEEHGVNPKDLHRAGSHKFI